MPKTRAWPFAVDDYLLKWILGSRSPAFLFTDRNGRVVSRGGALSYYGLDGVGEGERVADRADFLEGLLPADGDQFTLSRVETTNGVFADIHLFRVSQGDCVLLLDASADVRERTQIEQALRQAEERLRQGEKMEALGRLAGGVAHDFNNLLTIILGYSNMLVERTPSGESREAARHITEAAQRAAAMTQHLLSFSRRRVLQTEVLDLNALIARLEQPLRRLIGEDIILTTVLKSSLSCVEADAGQMEQILVNLCANARDAMPAGGGLEIQTSDLDIDDAFKQTHPDSGLGRGSHVTLSVSDTGVGIDSESMARVFEPFFTSKPAGQGTGLGLSIVYGIVSQWGGQIQLSSAIGKGTEVKIFLPAVQKIPDVERPIGKRSPRGGTGNILVVEDEDEVRDLVTTVLTRLGYKIFECADPLAAIALCDRHPGKIDLLMTDLIMPTMDGCELARRLSAIRPEMRVLYVSGYAKESFAQRGMMLPSSVFLEKPFTPGHLAEKVRDALAQPARSKRAS